ncbi:MAG TPA: hypothetical protein VNT32_05320 [Thermoleophilaceae bacterium]|nr:hypothetical protein [Thermoleophilaceae bacterium]
MDASLVQFHVIEPGVNAMPTLFKVTMWVPDTTRDAIGEDDPYAWREVLGKTKRLVDEHLESRRAALD